MSDKDEKIDEYPYARPLLMIDMPRQISDQTALQLSEMMQRLICGFNRRYEQQIQRAQVERKRAVEEFWREQEALKRERNLRAAELDIPLCDDSDDDDQQLPF